MVQNNFEPIEGQGIKVHVFLEGHKNWQNLHRPAPYLAGVLGVPEHPRNLGVQKGAKPDFCLSEFSYYYEHPRI